MPLKQQLQAWFGHREVRSFPEISLQTTLDHYKSFTSPNPHVTASIHNADGAKVATAVYALSPLADRVYLFSIEVKEAHRRQGYGFAVLRYLAQTYGQPITAVKELFVSTSFWDAARTPGSSGIQVTQQLSVGDMDKEASRWKHLQPDKERLERLISERLFVHQEPWHIAIGRGLDCSPSPAATPSIASRDA